jgi:hypothetical protein
MRTRLLSLTRAALALFSVALTPAVHADGPGPGFGESILSFSPPVFAVGVELSGGDLITFDGLVMERVDASGALVESYQVLPAFAFPSFVVVAPDESFAVVGESTNGDLFRRRERRERSPTYRSTTTPRSTRRAPSGSRPTTEWRA